MKLSDKIRNIESSKQFKKTILGFSRPKEHSIYAIHDISGLKLRTRLRLNFSHLNEHKFRHNLRIPLTQCAVVVLNQKLQITISCAVNYRLTWDYRPLIKRYTYYKPIFKKLFWKSTSKYFAIWFWKFYIRCKRKYSKTYNWISKSNRTL